MRENSRRGRGRGKGEKLTAALQKKKLVDTKNITRQDQCETGRGKWVTRLSATPRQRLGPKVSLQKDGVAGACGSVVLWPTCP